jgi:transketolase
MRPLRAPREIIGAVLARAAETDTRLVVLDADLGRSTRLAPFEERFPDRYIQLGVAEQNAVGMASGLVYAGYHPVFVTFTMFAIGLPWTQLRQTAYAGLPIKIIGTHPGFDIGPDGGTHQMLEDIALARVIPELVVLSPSDTPETEAAIYAALNSDKMTYVRVGRHPVPDLHSAEVVFTIGKAEVIYDQGRDLVLIADGSMVASALAVGKTLAERGVAVSVINIRTIKPIDEELIRRFSEQARLLVTVENHTVLGGLGGLIAEIASEDGTQVLRIGSRDRFGESATTEELRKLHLLDVDGILEQIREAWQIHSS